MLSRNQSDWSVIEGSPNDLPSFLHLTNISGHQQQVLSLLLAFLRSKSAVSWKKTLQTFFVLPVHWIIICTNCVTSEYTFVQSLFVECLLFCRSISVPLPSSPRATCLTQWRYLLRLPDPRCFDAPAGISSAALKKLSPADSTFHLIPETHHFLLEQHVQRRPLK